MVTIACRTLKEIIQNYLVSPLNRYVDESFVFKDKDYNDALFIPL